MIKFKEMLLRAFTRANICLLIFALTMCVLSPIRNTFVKLCIVLLTFALWGSVLGQFWSKRKIRYVYLGITALIFLFCCMPSRSINNDRFRQHYVRSLCYYESKPYVWGAENFFAVDCSGLVRQGYVDASLMYGLKTFDGAIVREAILLWWFDSSAKAMRDGYRDRTKRLMSADSINDLDHRRILPGDFAVTTNGVHCLAYLGEHKWIQADPTPNRVVISSVPTSDSNWYEQPVYIIRWVGLKD